ncbi:MAG: hypothetical protein C0490_04505, partial [Marivirga sp.]|nr:hypothetical protein [Marivirga sp.]
TGIANNIVSLGAVKSEILTATGSQLTVKVLPGSNSVAPITITNLVSQKTATSLMIQPSYFTVTYPGGKFSPSSYVKSTYDVGTGPFSITSADFNADGKADIATANFDSNDVSVLIRNSANDGFNQKIDFAAGLTPRMIVSADFNGDGNADIATAADGASKIISVLIRNANPVESGGFTLEQNVTANLRLNSLTAGDINGDGKMDLVSANTTTNTVSVFLRNVANTGFVLGGSYGVGQVLTNVAVGDFNGDGKLDVAATSWNLNMVSILMRNSANTGFDSPLNYAVGVKPRGLNVGDFNGDGKSDIVVANHESVSVSVLIRNSSNTGFDPLVNYPVAIFGQWVVVGDFNGDGKSDLAVNGFQQTDPYGDNIFVLLNDGTGVFQSPIGFLSTGLVRSVTTGDFNGDGMADLFAANNNMNNVSLFESNLAIWKGEISSDWNQSANWWGKRVPTIATETVVDFCATYPQLSSSIQVRRLLIINAELNMNNYTIGVTEDTSVLQSKIIGQGSLTSADILEFADNTVEGAITLNKTGGVNNSWKGNNNYKGQLSIINSSTKTISAASQSPDRIEY